MKTLAIILLTVTTAIAFPKNIEPTRILSIDLPTTINKIESIYGKPINIELPDPEDPSPWGQWFRWKIKKKGLFLNALAGDYSQKPNHKAKVSVLTIQSMNPNEPVKTVHGYILNKTNKSTIQAGHTDTIQESLRFTVKYYENNIWTYYGCNKNGIINEIIQSTFDMDMAD